MKTTLEVNADIKQIEDWIDGKAKGWTLREARGPVTNLLWAYKEALEQNKILTKVLIEAAARGIELRDPQAAQAPKEA